jgi:hypothetical protein
MFEKFRGIGRKVAVSAAILGGLGAQEGLASQKKIELEKGNVAKAELVLEQAKKTGDQKKINEAELKLADQRTKLGVAIGEDADEKTATQPKQTQGTDINNIGAAHKNESTTKLTHREVDIRDNNGNVIGRAEEGSPEYVKLEMRRIDRNAKIEIERARSSRPIIVENPNNNQTGSQDSLMGSGGNR